MKDNIIKFVSRDIFEQRKFPLYGYLIDVEELKAQLAREEAEKKAQIKTNEAHGVQR
jgi:hypothetical protein